MTRFLLRDSSDEREGRERRENVERVCVCVVMLEVEEEGE